MQPDRISYLLQQYLDSNLSATELQEFTQLLRQEDSSGEVRRALEEAIEQAPARRDYQEADWDPLFLKIVTADSGERGKPSARGRVMQLFNKRGRAVAAAAILILLVGASWPVLFKTGENKSLPVSRTQARPLSHDIAPGGNKATLTLADSTTINLSEADNGLLAKQGNSRLIKRKDGQLAYQPTEGKSAKGAIPYNLLTTPKGGQYMLVLPDGSKVWLNAASSLKYPAAFTGKERVVELKGEAYFEVSSNPGMPFRVSVSHGDQGEPMHVEVLGTHFNVKAYSDEPAVNTTLLEGLVKVSKGKESALVRPGEHAYMNSKGLDKPAPADLEEAIAWKNGLFRFNEATLEDVMRQLSRWYDVEVVYVNGPTKDLFRGEIYRNVSVSKVLKVLEASGVRFTVEGKKILVQS